VSEACDLHRDDIDLPKRTIIVRRLKGSTDSVYYLTPPAAEADRIKAAYVSKQSIASIW
jgi:integrase